uniref:Putative ficolin/ixoderin n=1 Tax=Ixodes ricinus TaxID=34613 RepID=A0A6B0V7N9_IXORI
MRHSEPLTKNLNMFVAVLLIPVVAVNAFTESTSKRVPEISERYTPPKTYMIFDPCNTNKPGNRTVSCAQLRRQGHNMTNQYNITPHNKFLVWCDMETDGGGWTVIQRRSKTEGEGTEFERSKKDYDDGFQNSKSSSYWIGNENIHALTTNPNSKQVLRIEMTRNTKEKIIVQYTTFKVASKKEYYQLTIGGYSSPNGSNYDALKHHNGGEFVIANGSYHHDLCARSRISGGWWFPFRSCMQSNLNGRKLKQSSASYEGLSYYLVQTRRFEFLQKRLRKCGDEDQGRRLWILHGQNGKINSLIPDVY